MNQEVFNYLMNFWEHSLGSTVTTSDGEVLFICKIDPDDSSQVQLDDKSGMSWYRTNWYFIQDLIWTPSLEEAIRVVCNKLDINIHKESLQINKIIKPIPSSFEELYEIITDIRSHILVSHQ